MHKTIKKIEEDTERYSFNTAVSTFMICVNELAELNCHKKEILSSLVILLAPYAPHFAEELWQQLEGWVIDAAYPSFDPTYVTETAKEYPVSINGKLRANILISLEAGEDEVRAIVLENDIIKKWVEDKPIKKLIFIKGKMVNIVV